MLKNKKNEQTKGEALTVFSLVFDIGYTIAIPAVGFSFGGRYLDMHFGTSPLFLLLGIFTALSVSSYAIYRKIKRLQ